MNDLVARHQITRIRRETRRRLLTVAAVEPLGNAMRRIRFTSDDLADFDSAAPDDHIKLILPGAEPENGRPAMRDYTPRAFAPAAGTLTIDFAVHGEEGDAGPATSWAMAAIVGDQIQIGGPRGSSVVADDFDWYLLIGDETAIPAISRRIEHLRRGTTVIAVISLLEGRDRPPISVHDNLTVIWSTRGAESDGGATLLSSLEAITLPSGEGFVWIGAEASAARLARSYMIAERGQPMNWMKASGYWSKGEAGTHAKIGDD